MIPTRHAGLLELPPETAIEEARQRCERLLETVRQEMIQLPPGHPDWTRLEERCLDLEKTLKELAESAEPEAAEAEPEISNAKSEVPGSSVTSTTEAKAAETTTANSPPPPTSYASDANALLSEELRKTLDLGESATPDQALARAETRLKETMDAQCGLKPRHPAQPRLKRDRERFERMVTELREIAFGQKVDELCDRAEEALEAQPANKTKARDCVRRARQEAKQLPPESGCLRRLQNLETRLDGSALVAAPAPPPEPVPALAAPPTHALLPDAEVAPTPMATGSPAAQNAFAALEDWVDKGMAALTQDAPDAAAAHEHFAAAEKEAADKNIPANLRSRMQLFKRMLDQVRREKILVQIGVTLQQSAEALGQSPPGIAESRERLAHAEALLQQVPDPFLQGEAGRVARAIEEHEQWLAHYQNQPTAIEEFPAQPQPAYPSLFEPASVPETLHVSTEPPPPREPEPGPVPPPIPKKNPRRATALQFGLALLVLSFIGIAIASIHIIKVASTPGQHAASHPANSAPAKPVVNKAPARTDDAPLPLGELSVTVTPSDAELFTNGVAMGHIPYPVLLRGVSGQEVLLEARLEGYSNATRTVQFPLPQSPADETLELQPRPALLIVRSEPAASQVTLRNGQATPQNVERSDDGIEIEPGVPMELLLEVPDYETVVTNLPALKPGEQRLVDFGKLHLQTAMLRLKAEPPAAQFSVIYPGREPIPYGTSRAISDIIPRVAFEVVASCPGYASISHSFLLKPRESVEYDFGRLMPLPASLSVAAMPANYNLKVAWDGASKDYGADGHAAGLPPGKNLLITVFAAGHDSVMTNLTLEPGEKRELFFGGLQPARSYLLLKSEPPGAEVAYSIDGHFLTFAGAVNRIEGLPLGHTIEVTLHKPGYENRTLTNVFTIAGDTLDFGRLTPLATNDNADPKTISPAKPAVNLQAARYSPANLDKLLREIDAYTIIVRNNIPLTETSRHDWNDWINKVEAMYRSNDMVWTRMQAPLGQLRDMVNRTVPPQVVPVTARAP